MKYGESSNHQMKHFNNAYQFFETKNAFRVTEWQPGYEFDYDCINQEWSTNIRLHNQEKNGHENTLPGFQDPKAGDFTITSRSASMDAGKQMNLPELSWKQAFEGKAPDIGAFEGIKRVEGPPFRFIPSPDGAYYEEYPRITRHYVQGPFLLLYLSAPLKNDSYIKRLKVFEGSNLVSLQSATLLDQGYALLLEVNQVLTKDIVGILFEPDIKGINGLPLISWGSTIAAPALRENPELKFKDLWSETLPAINEVKVEHYVDSPTNKLIVKMTMDPVLPIIYRGILGFSTEQDVYLDGAYPEYTDTGAIYTVDISQCTKGNYELTLLIAGQLFKKKIVLD
ncbi:MAG: hypothetical protein IPL46_23615 [Saprospiraceae bacterium]|nr:hypothetical protein [Saprospiraceae bacterium]